MMMMIIIINLDLDCRRFEFKFTPFGEFVVVVVVVASLLVSLPDCCKPDPASVDEAASRKLSAVYH